MSRAPVSTTRREFIVKMSSAAVVIAAGGALSACGGSTHEAAAFNYGVASGDPLSDRVILWTHAKYGSDDPVELVWQVAADANFSPVLQAGTVTATKDSSFTAKADATGLTAGTEYYYRFLDSSGNASAVGRARTLPVGVVNEVKLAVFSCSDYPAGYFNAYGAAVSSGAQFALHLGDYIYEYKDGVFPAAASAVAGRVSAPPNECVTLADYRARHATHKSDPNAKTLHARMPMIAVWDDHEFANNGWTGGAENHNPATQGPWAARKAAASQAYHEWMPIRTPDKANLLKIYRSFDFGSLLSLHMLDTRIVGRDQQVDRGLDAAGRDVALAAGAFNPFSNTKQLLGTTQESWLTTQMTASKATWQVLGQQIVMARVTLPLSTLSATDGLNFAAVTAYLTAKATPVAARTQTQKDLLDLTKNPKIPYNFDAWDGYPTARETVLTAAAQLKSSGKKFVVLSGDTHNAWYSKLTLANGSQVGMEFAGSSVSSPGFESFFPPASVPPAVLASTIVGLTDDLQYIDTARRGYLLMTFTPAQAKGEFVFVSTVTNTNYTVDVHTETYVA